MTEKNIRKLFMSMKKLATFSIILGSAFLFKISVNAEDTEALLNEYGLTLGAPIKSELEAEIESLEGKLEDIELMKNMDDSYNHALQNYLTRLEKDMDSVLNNISVYQEECNSISSRFEEDILTADINTLLGYDRTYKLNTTYCNELLQDLGKYKFDFSYRNIEYNSDEYELGLEKAKELYIESLDTFDLGDVSNIRWIMNNEMYVTSPYGYRIDPVNPSNIRFHSGTDFRAAEGTAVGALFNGVVTSCGWSDTAGNFITVQCGDNVKYFICHLSEIFVTKGDIVNQYDIIGLTGNTGSRTTGPHLHLALYLNGSTYDVMTLLK